MKLMVLFFFIACMHVSASSFSQGVTLSEKNAPLDKVLKSLEKQTGYSFWYEYNLLKNARNVDIEVKEIPLAEVLVSIFKDQPLSFEIIGKTVVIKEKAASEEGREEAPVTGMRGRVLNERGQPLENANVVIKRTHKGTITDVKGEFFIKNLRPDDVIMISFIGYESLTVKPGKDPYVTIMLKDATDELDKTVVKAYGVTSQRLAIGDITTITAAEIEKQPVMNPLMALQGRVAGLDIQQTSGYASAPILATIRGRGTVDPNQVTDPLYVIDGVPLTVVNISPASGQGAGLGSFGFLQGGMTGPAEGQSPLFSLNPSDIESISVLKDADATSIYGSRGANGVILINTKKGKPGRTQLSLRADEGITKATRFWQLLNTPQYLAMRREAFKNDGITPNLGNAFDLLVFDTTRYTNWQKALYGRTGQVINTNLGLTGGNNNTSFRFGASYSRATEITTAHGADQKMGVSLGITHVSSDGRLSISIGTMYSFTQSDMVELSGLITFAPDAPAIYDSTGKINWAGWDAAFGTAIGSNTNQNPFSSLVQPYTAKTNLLNGNIAIGFQPVKGLNLGVSLGYNIAQNNQLQLTPITAQDPATQPTGSAQFGNNSNKNWVVEPQASYHTFLGPGKFNVTVGGSIQHVSTDGIVIYGSGYTNDALLRTISNASYQSSSDVYGEYRYASLFGIAGYNIYNKYLFDFNIRRDGSSNYGPGNQFGNFASVGAAWIFTEEEWFKHHLSFLSFGKFHGSYGLAGGDGGVPYAYLTRWTSSGLLPYNGYASLVSTQHANPNYQWTKNRKLEGAIALGFFKDWITVDIAFYRNRTNNQLLSYPTPYLTGFNTVSAMNLPALVQNAGWEFTFGGRGVHTKYFSWSPSFNFSINQNKFISFPGLGASSYRNQGVIGKPLGGLYVLHYTGVDPQTGRYAFQDKNHDGTINPNYVAPDGGDVYYKKLSPSIATGFGFNFDIKRINLSLFFNVKKQTGANAINQEVDAGLVNDNAPVGVLSRWKRPGDISNVGKFSTMNGADPNGYLSNSDIGYTDASYIRLQNLSITYNLPDAYVKRVGLHGFNFFVNANNIFVITGYKGIDPEVQNVHALPPPRTIVGGLSINF